MKTKRKKFNAEQKKEFRIKYLDKLEEVGDSFDSKKVENEPVKTGVQKFKIIYVNMLGEKAEAIINAENRSEALDIAANSEEVWRVTTLNEVDEEQRKRFKIQYVARGGEIRDSIILAEDMIEATYIADNTPDIVYRVSIKEAENKREEVNHPERYNEHPSGVECIDIVEHMNFNLGNAVKYIWRSGLKDNTEEDLKKAVWYIERELKKRSNEKND